jgi:hypothetical protein
VWLTVWLILRMFAIGIGAYCAGKSTAAYSNLDAALSPHVPEGIYSFLGKNDAFGMAIAGYALAAFAILLAFFQERATARQAVRTDTHSRYWLEEMNSIAGPALGTIMRAEAANRGVELVTYQDSLLRAAARAWGGMGNADEVRLRYFKFSSAIGGVMQFTYELSLPAEAPEATTVAVKRPLGFTARKRRLGRFWGGTAHFPDARKSTFSATVLSPLNPQANPIGLVVGDSPKRRTFTGEASRVGGRALGQWVAAGEVVARPDLRA